jgi:hypothetical protein
MNEAVSDAIEVQARGRKVVISPAELERELDAAGPVRSLAHLEALLRAADREVPRARVIERLHCALPEAGVGILTIETIYALVRLSAGGAARETAADLTALGERLGGPPGAVARSAAFLVADRVDELVEAAADEPLLARQSPHPFRHLTWQPAGTPRLAALWLEDLRHSFSASGSTAFRAHLGDVGEALFRAVQHGARTEALLQPADRAFLVDTATAELGGTTDFLAARGMTWLLGILARDDDSARAAIERAQARFRDPDFQTDCERIFAGAAWPP